MHVSIYVHILVQTFYLYKHFTIIQNCVNLKTGSELGTWVRGIAMSGSMYTRYSRLHIT